MSESRPESPVRRPETARPRAESIPQVEPPSADELAAIQQHLVTLPGQEGASVSVDADLGVTLVSGPGNGPDLTYAAMPSWDPGSESERLRAVRERMRADGVWPSLLTCEGLDHLPGLDDELLRQGWMKATGEIVMWVGHASVVPHLDPALRIEAIQPRSMERHETIERDIFGAAAEQAARRRVALRAALEDGRLRAWIVWLGDEPVAVSRLSQGQGAAGLQGIGVIGGRRRQGYGTLITTVATRAGMASGNRIVWLSVREDNRAAVQLYSRLGFERTFSWTRWLASEDPPRR